MVDRRMQVALLLMITVAGWGFYHNACKLASHTLSPAAIPIVGVFCATTLAPLYYWMLHRTPIKFSWQGVGWATAAYYASALGSLAYMYVLSKSEVSQVVSISTSYPILTMLIAVFFMGEEMTTHKFFGLLLVLAGVFVSSRGMH